MQLTRYWVRGRPPVGDVLCCDLRNRCNSLRYCNGRLVDFETDHAQTAAIHGAVSGGDDDSASN